MAKTCVDKNVKIISTISQSVLILKMYEKKFDDTKGAIRIVQKGQTIQWPKVKDKRTNNNIQNTTQKTKD